MSWDLAFVDSSREGAMFRLGVFCSECFFLVQGAGRHQLAWLHPSNSSVGSLGFL